jgi:hypothetical protein
MKTTLLAAAALAAACLAPTLASADEHEPAPPASCKVTVTDRGNYRVSFTASPDQAKVSEYRYREFGYKQPFVSLHWENFSDVWPHEVHSDSPQFAVRALLGDKTHSAPCVTEPAV